MTMSQISQHKETNIARIMGSKAFNEGFKDVRNKRQFRYDVFLTDTEAWAYELGRQFALSYIGPLKLGSRVSVMAISALNELVRSGMIK